ncbi:MAG: FtsX-like permease family protein [Mariniphaga sp.]
MTGVFKDIPHNAHLQYNGLISSMTIAEQIGREQFESREPGAFWNVQIYTYVLLEKNATIHSLLEKSPDFYEKYMKSLGDQINASFALDATALTDIYLSKKDLQFDVRKGNRSFIYIFSVVAFLILIMAVINYMSLSTARSTLRFREIGMKKVVGAHKRALIFQFISESLIFSFAALFIALFFVILLLPVFNQLSGKAIDTGYLLDPIIVTGIILIGIFVGLLSGSYPAFYLSSFNPVTVLKGKGFSEMNGTARFRRSLVVVQFAISVLMIIGTLTISRQLNYIQHKEIGYNTEDVVILTLRDTTLQNSVTAFKNELKKIPGVISVSSSSTVPIYGYGKQVMRVEDENGEMVETALNNYFIDQEYLGVMELELAEGRNYSREMTSDMNSAFLINETAARHLGWAGVDSTTEKVKYSYKNTIGKRIHYGFDLEGNIARNGKVVGVIKDFNFSTLHNPIEPIILLLGDEQNMQYLSIRIRPDNTKQILSDIESLEDEFNTAFPFNYRLLDNEIANLYKDDRNINRIFRYMTILTIIIAVLGLLGLSAYMAGQRTKEIGIRKVIGATELQVVFMLMQDFSKWVIIANIIAIPVAYYAIQRWLQDFVYRVETSWWLFGLGFLISLVIALITVSWYSLKVAMQNPTDSLKFE